MFDENRIVSVVGKLSLIVIRLDAVALTCNRMLGAFAFMVMYAIVQTRDDFLGMVEIQLRHSAIQMEEPGRPTPAKEFLLRQRRCVLTPSAIHRLTADVH